MEKDEGILFLLRCAKVLQPEEPLAQATSEQQTNAEAIVNVLDGLPLALDQAGAYIEETGCSLPEYLTFYQAHKKELLRKRGSLSTHYPESVATTWSLSFQQIEQNSLPAADLLRVCAFLDPDAIPEEMLVEGATHLGPSLASTVTDPFQLAELVQHLNKFSLVQRNAEQKFLRIHRLVQAVLRDEMTQETQKTWAERVVYAVNEAYPADVDVNTRSKCERYLPHALICTILLDQYRLAFLEAARLFHKVCLYVEFYMANVKFTLVEPLYVHALDIKEQVLGPTHSDTADTLHVLAQFYHQQHQYAQAEPLYRRALSIRENVEGPNSKTADTIQSLAELYHQQHQYAQAEPLYLRALSIREQLEPTSALERLVRLDLHSTLHHLGFLYKDLGQYERAKVMFNRCTDFLDRNHPDWEIAIEYYDWLCKKLH